MKVSKGFWRRLKYYGIGVFLGVILVFLIFGQRACSWLPGNRVRQDILGKVIVFPEKKLSAIHKIGVNKRNITRFVAKGDIEFNNSIKERGSYPKAYVFSYEDSTGKTMKLQFSLYEDSYITVAHPLTDGKPISYDNLKGWGKMIRFPKDSSLIFIDQSDYSQCKAEGLATRKGEDILSSLKNSGRVNFSKSDLMKPKAVQYITFQEGDTKVKAKTILFHSKITFKDFYWDYKLPCEEEAE